ncbi:MAG TPA: hypothetical protein VGI22_18970 [Xanthobacteraceae bacterium]
MTVPARRDDHGQLGPAMRVLSERHRAFVRAYLQNLNPKLGGGKAAACRAAGLGESSTVEIQAKRAWDLAHDDRVLAAIAEESKKYIRGGAPDAVSELMNIVHDRSNAASDRLRGIGMILARNEPEVQRTDLHVTHKVISRDEEELEEYRASIEIGASPSKLRERVGGNRVPELERLDAEDRANKAKVVIDADVIEVAEEEPVRTPARKPVAAERPAEQVPAIDPEMLEDL